MSKDYGFNVVKRGYDINEVIEYIESLEEIIKSYKEKDSAIKNAILSAQVAADSIVLNAKNEAKAIKEEALRTKDKINEDTKKYVAEIKREASIQKSQINEFERDYANLVGKYLKNLEENDLSLVTGKIDSFQRELDHMLQSENDKDEKNK